MLVLAELLLVAINNPPSGEKASAVPPAERYANTRHDVNANARKRPLEHGRRILFLLP
jgi:hypothetical protein